MKKLLFFVLIFAIHNSAHSAEGFSTLEERMTGKEFMETGLGNLSDAELSALNEWIRRHSVATLDNAAAAPAAASAGQLTASEDRRGLENQRKTDKSDDTIFATIDGSFSGWSGTKTIFKLTNGMVWKQSEGDTFYVGAVMNPDITIKKNLTGGWRLSMVGYNNTVSVKRIK